MIDKLKRLSFSTFNIFHINKLKFNIFFKHKIYQSIVRQVPRIQRVTLNKIQENNRTPFV